MTMIRPSTALRNEYSQISSACHENGEPIFITHNGEVDLVVISIEAYYQREASLELREKLLEAEEQLASGVEPVSLEEAKTKWRAKVNAVHAH